MKQSIISPEQVKEYSNFISNLFNPNYDYICVKCGEVHDSNDLLGFDEEHDEQCPNCGANHQDYCSYIKGMDAYDIKQAIEEFLSN